MSARDGILDKAAINEIRDRHYREGSIPEHHPAHPCDACRLLLTFKSRPATDPAGLDVERLRDAVAAMASVLVLAERDGQWPHYTAIARRAYDAAGGTLRAARLSVADKDPS